MRIISLEQFLEEEDFFTEEALKGKIFVYPTDTIYGVGSIISPYAIKTIDAIKQRLLGKSYSIIAPNFQRTEENFEVDDFTTYRKHTKQSLEEGRGLTVLCPLKEESIATIGIVSGNTNVGIRYIDHPIQNFVRELGQPFITTSANISGDNRLISSPSHLTKEQTGLIDYFITSEITNTQGSVIIDRETKKVIRS